MTDQTAAPDDKHNKQGDQPRLSPPGYQDVQMLSAELHANLGLNLIDKPYAFAKKLNAVPATVAEFRMLAPWYPIVFAKGERPMPIAVLGIEEDINDFVDNDGNWEPLAYLPGYIRRYPFLFSATGAKNESGHDQMVFCVDRAAPMIAENAQQPLMTGKDLSEFGQQAFEFCKNYQQEMATSQQFSKLLVERNLLDEKELTITPNEGDKPVRLGKFLSVDEERLKKLPADQLTHLAESGALGAIYAHIISLQNWQTLHLRWSMKHHHHDHDH